MYYRHDLDISYPDKCDAHMLRVKKKRTLVFDENYSYYPASFWYKLRRVGYFLLIQLNAAAEALRAEVYRKMQEMNGIYPGDPTYNEDQNPENYQKTVW